MDFALEDTFDIKFTSRAFATGIPTVLAGSPVIEVYEDNSTSQITAGETLSVDFDSVVGLNNLRIVGTAANGYEAGKSYTAILSVGTVSGVSVVGEVVAQWTCQRATADVVAFQGTAIAETATSGIANNFTTFFDNDGTSASAEQDMINVTPDGR